MKKMLLSSVAAIALIAAPALAGEANYYGHSRYNNDATVNELTSTQKMGATVQVDESLNQTSGGDWVIYEGTQEQSNEWQSNADAGKNSESSASSASHEASSSAKSAQHSEASDAHEAGSSKVVDSSDKTNSGYGHHYGKGGQSSSESHYFEETTGNESAESSQKAAAATEANANEYAESASSNSKANEWASTSEQGRSASRNQVRDERHNQKVTSAKKSVATGNITVGSTGFGAGVFTQQNNTGKNSAVNNASSVAAQLNESPDKAKGDLTNTIVSTQELTAQVAVNSIDTIQADNLESTVKTGDIAYNGGTFGSGIFTLNNNTGVNNAGNNATSVAVQVNGAGILGVQ